MKKELFFPLFFSLLNFNNAYADTYKVFYYEEKKELENRLIDFIRNGSKIIVNYPHSQNPEVMKKERELMINYGIDTNAKNLLNDLQESFKKNDFYGMVMIAASLPSDKTGSELKLIMLSFINDNIGTNKFNNSILGFCGLTLINKNLLIVENKINKGALTSISELVENLEKNGYLEDDFKMLKNLDRQILQSILTELNR